MELKVAMKFLEDYKEYLDKEDRKFASEYRLMFLESMEKIIHYIKEESIPKTVVEEKIKAILKEGKNMTEEERQKETMFLQGKLIALEELLNKGETDEN